MKKTIILSMMVALFLLNSLFVQAGADPRIGVFPTTIEMCLDSNNDNLTTTSDDSDKNLEVFSSDPHSWCEPDWQCTQWSECNSNGAQYRVCVDAWRCGTNRNLPAESQSCNYVPSQEPQEPQEDVFNPNLFQGNGDIVVPVEVSTSPQEPKGNGITGAVIGGISGDWRLTLAAGLFIAGLFMILLVGSKKN